jgi:signal transduction histidine kinase
MLGYTREEILELTPLRLVSKEARKAIPRITQRIERSGWLLFETTLTAKDRRQIPVEINADILVFHGRRMVLAIIRDITERQKEIRELKHRAGRLQKLTFELLQAADRERKRLAEVLHDDLQQTLAAATFQLGRLTSRVRSEAQLQEIVAQVQQMLKDAIEKARSLSHELGPVLLARGGLDETFEWLARQMEQRHGLAVHVETRGRVDSSSEPVRTFLYRAAQEILFNVVKHAQVSEARLRLQRVRNQIWLTISDKGQGFDPRSLARTAGFGLLSVRERAELLGGRMRIRSTMGRGSTFLITIPDTGRSPADDSTTGSPPPGTD